jgi:hypothetical protein
MDLVLFNSQSLELMVGLDDRGSAFGRFNGAFGVRFGALAPSRAVAVGELRYRDDALSITFRPLLAGHRGE